MERNKDPRVHYRRGLLTDRELVEAIGEEEARREFEKERGETYPGSPTVAHDLEGFHFVPSTIEGPFSTLGYAGNQIVSTGRYIYHFAHFGWTSYALDPQCLTGRPLRVPADDSETGLHRPSRHP
jgi:hypothetical protein